MKNVIAVFLALMLLFLLAACVAIKPDDKADTPSDPVEWSTTSFASESSETAETTFSRPILQPLRYVDERFGFAFMLFGPQNWIIERDEALDLYVENKTTGTSVSIASNLIGEFDSVGYIAGIKESFKTEYSKEGVYSFAILNDCMIGNAFFKVYSAAGTLDGASITQYILTADNECGICVITATAKNGESLDYFLGLFHRL